MRLRCALLGVGGLSIASCNAIFGISDPEPNAEVGTGGTSNTGGSSGGEVGGSGGSNTSNGGTENATGGSGEPGGAGGGGDGGVPESTVRLSGVVRLFHTRAPSAGVELTAFVGASERFNATSGEDGAYSLDGIPARSTVNLELAYADPDPQDPPRPAALFQTRIRFDVGDAAEQQLDLSHIDFGWLARTANDCGAYRDPVTVNQEEFFNLSASVVVQVTDGGQGVAGVAIEALQVTLTNGGSSEVNTHNGVRVPPDTNPTFVCALEDSDSGLYPSQAPTTNELGLLVMFRVRNTQGTGSGEAVVSLTDSAATSSVSLRQSGQSGVVVLGD